MTCILDTWLQWEAIEGQYTCADDTAAETLCDEQSALLHALADQTPSTPGEARVFAKAILAQIGSPSGDSIEELLACRLIDGLERMVS